MSDQFRMNESKVAYPTIGDQTRRDKTIPDRAGKDQKIPQQTRLGEKRPDQNKCSMMPDQVRFRDTSS